MHQWLTEDVGDPMLAQHLHSLMMFQRLAIANGFGWQRFLHMVDQVLPRRGDTLQLPFEEPDLDKKRGRQLRRPYSARSCTGRISRRG